MKLSKRHGAVNVLEYREEGYLPDAMVNYLARLGWSHGDQELFSRAELIELFDIQDVNASASRFSGEKLAWVNQQHMMSADPAALVEPLIEQMGMIDIDPALGPSAARVIEVYRERAETLRELAAMVRYLYEDEVPLDEGSAKKHLRPLVGDAMKSLRDAWAGITDWTAENIHAAMGQVCEQHELKFGKIGMPVRVAITGAGMSPSIDATAELVGQERALSRMDKAIAYIEARTANSG